MQKCKKSPKYVCIFPNLKNTHIIKDVGMIPYTMGKYYNYDSYIATYDNDEYQYLEDKKSYLKLIFIKKYFNYPLLDIGLFLLKFRDINVLQVFFLQDTLNIFLYSLIFKVFNRNSKFYVKLDASDYSLSMITKKNFLKRKFQSLLITYLIDCISIETSQNYKKLTEMKLINPKKLIYIPNGIDNEFKTKLNNKKEDYILTVGRLGTIEKATEVLLESFAKIKNLKNWKLILIGDIDRAFQDYIDNYYTNNPNLRNKVIFKGHITNRDEIYKYYLKSKIFCLTSRWESFGISLVEATYFGNYLVSTDVGGAKDVLNITNYGELVKIDDTDFLALRLQDLILNWEKYEKNPDEIMELIKKSFNWKSLCKILHEKLN